MIELYHQLGHSEDLFSKYCMCTPNLSTDFYVNDVCVSKPTPRSISLEAMDLAYGYLDAIGVEGGLSTIKEVLQGWSMDSSPGPGLSAKFDSRASVLPFALASDYPHVPGLLAAGVVVKEETCKKEKFDRGDFRIILNHSTRLLFWGKIQNWKLAKALARVNFMLKGLDGRLLMQRIAISAERGKKLLIMMDASKMDRTICAKLYLQLEDFLERFGPRLPWYREFMSKWTFWAKGPNGPEIRSTDQAYPSGKDNTSEDETLIVFLLTCQFLLDIGRSDLIFEMEFFGCGDDTLILLPISNTSSFHDEFVSHFASFGLVMKISLMQGRQQMLEGWDLMGSTLVVHQGALYPVWSYQKSLFRWAYTGVKEQPVDVCLRMAQALNYLVYHPQYDLLERWVLNEAETTLHGRELLIVKSLIRNGRKFYVVPQARGFGFKEMTDSVATPTPEKEIERALRGTSTTPSGEAWLKCAIDPFYDHPVAPKGYPDMKNGRSLVYTYTESHSITRPPDLPSGQLWDAHIAFTGNLSVDSYSGAACHYDPPSLGEAAGSSPEINISTSGDARRYGGICVMAGRSGVDMDAAVNATWTNGIITCYSPYQASEGDVSLLPPGRLRLIGGGMEVCNTTAELYRGGSVTGYQSQNLDDDLSFFIVNQSLGHERKEDLCSEPAPNSDLFWSTKVNTVPLPPKSLKTCVQVPGSVTHGAEKGAYQAFRLGDRTVPASRPVTTPQVHMRIEDDNISGTTPCLLTRCPSMAEPWKPPVGYLPTKFHPCGMYFTGLNDQTTLTLTARWYVEYFPDPSETDKIVLSTPSPSPDNVALETYFAQVCAMPVMVTFDENGMGKWFRRVLKGIKAADTVVSHVAPFASLISPQAGAALEAYELAKAATRVAKKDAKSDKKRRDAQADAQIREYQNKPELLRARKEELKARIAGQKAKKT